MASELTSTTDLPGVFARCSGQTTAMRISTPIKAATSASPPRRGTGCWWVWCKSCRRWNRFVASADLRTNGTTRNTIPMPRSPQVMIAQ